MFPSYHTSHLAKAYKKIFEFHQGTSLFHFIFLSYVLSCHIILRIAAYHAVCFLKLRTTKRELNIDFNKGTLIAVLGYPSLTTATC